VNYLRHISIACVAAVLGASLAGCNPYEFKMGGPHIVSCEILTSLGGVDHDETMATLRDTAAIDLNYYGATQYYLTMAARLDHGEGFRVMLRPVVEHRDVKDSGLVVTATRSGVWIDSAGHRVLSRPDILIPTGQVVHVALLSDDHYTQIVFECDTVYRGWTRLKESDDVVVQALEGSQVDVIRPDWAGLPDREPPKPAVKNDERKSGAPFSAP